MADSSDDEVDWEEVDVSPVHQDIEITLNARPKRGSASKKGQSSYAKRLTRIHCHKIHTVCLLVNAWVRNNWINDPLLHARLISLTPFPLQNSFTLINKSRVPDQNQRGRLFEAAMTRLTEWWSQSFFEVDPSGHIRNRTFDDVQSQIAGLSLDDLLDAVENDENDVEVIRSSKSLMKHTLMQHGSRDTSAQLFTALCRGLQIPARLVVSLQSVPWQASVGKPKTHNKKITASNGKGEEKEVLEDDRSGEEIPIDVIGKGKAKEGSFPGTGTRLDGGDNTIQRKKSSEPTITLRKPKNKGHRLGSSSIARVQRPADPTITPPVFWTEVFSRPDARWLPVDPIRNIVNKRKVFDPSPSPGSFPALPAALQENRMVYVVAFEEDGYARDVTPRYAKEYGAKVAKAQEVGGRVGGGGKGRKEWWERVISIVTRPYRLLRDDLEDEELRANQLMEGMPTAMAGFKNHPLYVLSRHLRRDEVIHPLTELGKFRGETVYPRSSVVALKTAENWMRSGRVVRAGCQPMKLVKMRAATVGKLREIELAEEMRRGAEKAGEGASGEQEEVMQGMYAESQTELYVPEPIIDGKIPKNNFGNIDLYVPSMLPKGAAHIPYKGAVKIARRLGFSYAEAVTGFEFRKRRAIPIIEGIVVAVENEQVLLEAYWEAEHDAGEKAKVKRQERVIKRWTRLIQGLRLRQRLQEQYAERPEPSVSENVTDENRVPEVEEVSLAGGYLTAVDDVVKPYHLPKSQYPQFHSSPSTPTVLDEIGHVEGEEEEASEHKVMTYDLEMLDDDQDLPNEDSPILMQGVPKTMYEMAEEAARMHATQEDLGEPLTNSGSASRSPRRGSRVKNTKGTREMQVMNGKAMPRTTRATSSKKRRREESRSPSVSPEERGRGGNMNGVPSTTRVLRPRAPKSAAKIEEEKAREAAYRRAIIE